MKKTNYDINGAYYVEIYNDESSTLIFKGKDVEHINRCCNCVDFNGKEYTMTSKRLGNFTIDKDVITLNFQVTVTEAKNKVEKVDDSKTLKAKIIDNNSILYENHTYKK
jgi:hypothetical protein